MEDKQILEYIYTHIDPNYKKEVEEEISEVAEQHMDELDRDDVSGLFRFGGQDHLELTRPECVAVLVNGVGIPLESIYNSNTEDMNKFKELVHDLGNLIELVEKNKDILSFIVKAGVINILPTVVLDDIRLEMFRYTGATFKWDLILSIHHAAYGRHLDPASLKHHGLNKAECEALDVFPGGAAKRSATMGAHLDDINKMEYMASIARKLLGGK